LSSRRVAARRHFAYFGKDPQKNGHLTLTPTRNGTTTTTSENTLQKGERTMGAQPSPVSPPLSRGVAIEYKAFARAFNGGGSIISVIATCYYPTPKFTIYFSGGPTEFELLETRPQGIVNELVTYYGASWTSSQRLEKPPKHVTIADARGTHKVTVEAWR
jgi:hypothetical protein